MRSRGDDRRAGRPHRPPRASSTRRRSPRCWPRCPARARSAAACATRWRGAPVADVDVAAPLPPEDIAARLRAAGLKVFETGLAHGTVTAVLDHAPVEVTALRRDVLTDGRHAEVEWTTDWREDAARRDFTINAMSLAPDGALCDYFGGREDLAAGRVRFVGDPDDAAGRGLPARAALLPLPGALRRGASRMRRRWRRSARAVPGLARLSAERVWMELKRHAGGAGPGGGGGADGGDRGAGGGAAGGAASTSLALRCVCDAGAPRRPAAAPGRAAARGRGAAAAAARRTAAAVRRGARMLDRWRCTQRAAREPGRPGRRGPRSAAGAAAWLLAGGPQPEQTLLRRIADWSLRCGWSARSGARPAHWPALRARIARDAAARVFPLQGRDALDAAACAPGPAGRARCWRRCAPGGWRGGCTATRDECLAELARRIAAGPGAAPADDRGVPPAAAPGPAAGPHSGDEWGIRPRRLHRNETRTSTAPPDLASPLM